MIYREWDTPLYPEGVKPKRSATYIEVASVKCPPGSIAYVYDDERNLHILGRASKSDEEHILRILRGAKAHDEVGCYMPGTFKRGTYIMGATFILHPRAQCGNGSCFLDIYLAYKNRHLPYRNVSLTVVGAERMGVGSDLLYLGGHPESIGPYKWSVQAGPLTKSASLRLFLLVPSTRLSPDERSTSKTYNATLVFNSLLTSEERRANRSPGIIWVLALAPIIPAILAPVQYVLYGREDRPRMPIPVGFPPPTGEKPWEVALLYSGDPGSVSEEVYASAIVYMVWKGNLKIEPCNGELGLLPGQEPGPEDDNIIKTIYNIISTYNKLTRKPFCKTTAKKAAKNKQVRTTLTSLFRALDKVAAARGRELVKQALQQASNKPLGIYLAGLLLLAVYSAIILPDMLKPIIGVTIIVSVGTILAYLALPSHVLGKWKPGYLERYLAWQNFRDALRKRRYTDHPQNMVFGGDLAAYAAAVGEHKHLPGTSGVREAVAATDAFLQPWRLLLRNRATGTGGTGGGFGGGGAGAR